MGLMVSSNQFAMVCEYLKSGSVLDVLQSRGFNILEKYDILKQTASGKKQLK